MAETAIIQQQQSDVSSSSGSSLRHSIIVAASAKKIHQDLNNDKLLQSIGVICSLIGKQPPGNAEKLVMLDYIRKELGNYTPQELTLAFRMAMSGRLSIELDSIGVLNALTIQKVMDAYKAYTYEMRKQAEQQPQQPGTWSPADEDALYSKGIRELYEKYKANKDVWDGNWEGKHDWLVSKGAIEGKTADKEAFDKLRAEAKALWIQRTNKKMTGAKDMIEMRRFKVLIERLRAGEGEKGDDVVIRGYAKEIKVKRYFDKLIEEGK